jgi:hypothetical protein
MLQRHVVKAKGGEGVCGGCAKELQARVDLEMERRAVARALRGGRVSLAELRGSRR